MLTIFPFILQLVNFTDAAPSACMIEAPGGKTVFDPCFYCHVKEAGSGETLLSVCKIGAALVGNSSFIVIYLADFMIYAAESVCKFTEYLFNMHFCE